jgi:hypothetical protein
LRENTWGRFERYLITADKELLELVEVEGVKIVRAARYF